MNEFSILCRVLGSLYNRQPQDPLLVPLFTLLNKGKLREQWPLKQDDLLKQLEQSGDMSRLATDYNALFMGSESKVPPYGSQWEKGPKEDDVRKFLKSHGMPVSDAPTDHIGLLLLAASWLEDQSKKDDIAAQVTLFDGYLLPWCGPFFGKVEAHAETPFYRALAAISREAIQAMREELAEAEADQNKGDV